MIDNITHVVAATDLVFNLAKNLSDFVFDGISIGCSLLETM
jgi:hypothetical protein